MRARCRTGTCASVLDACLAPPRESAVSRRTASCANDIRTRTIDHASASAIGAIRRPAINPTVGWSVPVAHSQAPRSSPARTAVAPSGRSGIPSEASGRCGRLSGETPQFARESLGVGPAAAVAGRGGLRHRAALRLARAARAVPGDYPVGTACGRSVVVAQKPSKLLGRVRFPSPACTTPRGVAQSGSAPGWGPGGRRFKSCLPDSRKSLQIALFSVSVQLVGGHNSAVSNVWGVERAEAEAIYDAGREAVVEVLLAMDRRIAQLEARVEELERRLGRNSRNSSLPPSQDPPGAPPRRRGKDRSGRPPGGQSGHEGHGRELLPAWAVDELVDHWPASCGCGHVFAEAERVACREPARHQVEELPQIAVRVTEHRCQRVRCPGCGVGAHRRAARRGRRAARSGRACRRRSRRCRCATVSRAVTWSSSARSCSAPGSRTGSIDAILDRAGDALEAALRAAARPDAPLAER